MRKRRGREGGGGGRLSFPTLCVDGCVFLSLREKYTLEQDIRETEEAIRHKSSEVQVSRGTISS